MRAAPHLQDALPMRAGLYVDAARNMRSRQMVFRIRRLIPPALLAARPPTGTPPQGSWRGAGLGGDPAPQSGPTPFPHEDGAITAFGVRRAVGAANFWQDPSDGLLFLFHLHGFAELSRYALARRCPAGDAFWAGMLEDWLVRERRPSHPAWHPFPTSERIIAWSAALSSIGSWPDALRRRLTSEVWRQAGYLRRCVEYDIGGNHVLRNATALAFAGAAFPGTGLLDQALSLLRRETRLQFLTDGAHEERSTSYHRRVQHDLAEVVELVERAGHRVPDWLTTVVARAVRWQAKIAGPDRRLPLLNDAWSGPPLSDVGSDPYVAPEEAGFAVLRSGGDQVVFDVGPLCPPHLPAHAHADALSFVLWMDGRELIVDSGSFCYAGPLRDEFRGTAAHNSVEVDGCDQCVLWGNFRAGYLPRIRHLPPTHQGATIVLAGAHDGYRRLPDAVEHHRVLVWSPPAGLVVVDRLQAQRPHRVRSTLHLAPGTSVSDAGRVGPVTISALGPNRAVRRAPGVHSPYLGRMVPIPTLVDIRTVQAGELFGWSILRGGWRVGQLSAQRLRLERDHGAPLEIALRWA